MRPVVHVVCCVLYALASVACGFPRPVDVDPDAACPANEFIACEGDVARMCNATGDGTITQSCGVPGCNADARRCNQCVPNTDLCTSPSEIAHCSVDGVPAGQNACAVECVTSSIPHCAHLEPRYVPDACDSPATAPELTISNLAGLDTDLDITCTGGVIPQSGGPSICVVRYGVIHITSTATLTVRGMRALALVADSSVIIDGVLDVGANGAANGPGGGTVLSGARVFSDAGGGGAGFATAGGAGGSTTTDGGGGLGGGRATDPAIVTVLIGGTRPERTIGGGAPASGGGGGAATLIACRGQVSVSGLLDARGGGGTGGGPGTFAGSHWSGTGGGAGGNVVLQGLSIVVTGQVFANGGGGGAGWTLSGRSGLPGTDGTRSASDSASGGASVGGEGAGGRGGRQGAAPGEGTRPAASGMLPGGGGGSLGFFQTYTPRGIEPTLTPAAASPSFGVNKNVETR
jgi:hypothetical protein